MHVLDLTLPTAEENLALDEALLEEAEGTNDQAGVLRLWESPSPLVVIGRSSKIDAEVCRDRCRELGIPVLRRVSGGAAIVAGPGCLMYAVIWSHGGDSPLVHLDEAHRCVLEPLAASLAQHLPGVRWEGTSDLALDGRKFSGNSLRCKRTHILYHGTLLYDFDLALAGKLLRSPPRQPAYRQSRSHADFLTNLPLARSQLITAVCQAFSAGTSRCDWPGELTARLAEKYRSDDWNGRL